MGNKPMTSAEKEHISKNCSFSKEEIAQLKKEFKTMDKDKSGIS
jgi:Ca2+-binding EF-hand superfamily protein